MFSPAYSWEVGRATERGDLASCRPHEGAQIVARWQWGFFCCAAGSAFVANNPNWNVVLDGKQFRDIVKPNALMAPTNTESRITKAV